MSKLELKNIKFEGRIGIDEVSNCINQGDVCVLPRIADIICPIKIMEFMACAKPVMLPDYKCNREAITNGHDGITVEPFNENVLAEKIVSCYENRRELETIGQSAHETCIKRYTWEATGLYFIMNTIKKD